MADVPAAEKQKGCRFAANSPQGLAAACFFIISGKRVPRARGSPARKLRRRSHFPLGKWRNLKEIDSFWDATEQRNENWNYILWKIFSQNIKINLKYILTFLKIYSILRLNQDKNTIKWKIKEIYRKNISIKRKIFYKIWNFGCSAGMNLLFFN